MINTKYADPKEDHPDVQLIFGGYLADCAETGMVGEKKGTNRSIYVIPTILHPKSRGYLRLRNNDPLSKPLIYPKYLTHPDDVATLVEAIKFSIRLSETQALKRYELSILSGFPVDESEEWTNLTLNNVLNNENSKWKIVNIFFFALISYFQQSLV